MAAPQEPAVGDRIHGHAGIYCLVRPLGSGGFGSTWLAHREADGREVALKLLSLERMGEWKALELFEREGKVLATLDHPQIPRVHDRFLCDGTQAIPSDRIPEGVQPRWVLVQDYIAGASLRQRIAAGLALDSAAAVALLRGLLEILAYLHGRHPPVIHRDIHPGNVILAPDGRPSLVDFGATQRHHGGENGGSTTVGTFGYMPLEQLMGRARPASDLYALGATLLVALTHREPETLPVDEATGKIELERAVPGLAQGAPGLARALSAMLEPIVGQRVASASEVLALLDGPPALVSATAAPQGVSASAGQAALWHNLGGAIAGASLVAAGVLYVGFFDAFSETELVRLSVVWVSSLAFGLGIRAGARAPLVAGFLWAGLAAAALTGFIYGIFPSL